MAKLSGTLLCACVFAICGCADRPAPQAARLMKGNQHSVVVVRDEDFHYEDYLRRARAEVHTLFIGTTSNPSAGEARQFDFALRGDVPSSVSDQPLFVYLLNAPLGRDGDFYGPYGSFSPNGSWYDTHYGWPFSFLILGMPSGLDPAMKGDEPFSYSFSPTALVANTVMIAQKCISVPRSIAWIASCADNIAGPQGSRFARITLTLRRATFLR